MVQVNFVNDYKTVTTSPLTQWDYGQELQISGLTLPTAVQIHYATKNSQAATRFVAYQQGEYWVAKIPNALLEEGVDINAYIYTTDTDEGQTVKHIIIPVIPRLKPEDFISQPDPDEQEIIDELLAYVQDLVQDIDIAKTFSDVRIMTKAEYQALEEKENNVIYAFSDDSTLEEIEAEFDDVDSRFESDGTTAKKATNVTSQINGKAISDIFESDGTTVKKATSVAKYLHDVQFYSGVLEGHHILRFQVISNDSTAYEKVSEVAQVLHDKYDSETMATGYAETLNAPIKHGFAFYVRAKTDNGIEVFYYFADGTTREIDITSTDTVLDTVVAL